MTEMTEMFFFAQPESYDETELRVSVLGSRLYLALSMHTHIRARAYARYID